MKLHVLVGGLLVTAMLATPFGASMTAPPDALPEDTVPAPHPGRGLSTGSLVEGAPLEPTVSATPAVPLPGDHYAVGFVGAPPVRAGETFHGATVLDTNDDIDFATVRIDDPAAFLAGMVADDRVLYYEPDLPLMKALYTPNDPKYGPNQYDLKPATTDAQTAWDTQKGTTATKVCVTDTGVRKSHEDLTGATHYFWKDEIGGQANAYDDQGHGTHVTGTIAAVLNNAKGIAGVAQVSIGHAKVLNAQGSGTFTQIANGITDCKDSGAHVISMSLGCDGGIGSACDSTTMHNAVTSAYNAGILVVAAAGNAGPCTNCIGTPAVYTETIAITCSDENNGFCGFSSQGPEAFVMAPGNNIVSTYKTSDTSYATLSGTSMSTPHVAGQAALIKSQNPTWDRVNIKTKIKDTAVSQGLGQNLQGYGLINYKNAVGGGAAPTVPGTPTLTATAGNAQVSLSWTAPSNGGASITSYKVYRGTTSGGEALLTTGGCSGLGNVLSCTDTGLTNGQAYYYQVSAVNSVGEGARSAEKSATPVACAGPSNNCFASPTTFTSVPYSTSQSTSGATMETGEPAPCGSIGASVWFRFTAGSAGTATLSTVSGTTNYDTVLAAYTGNAVGSLTNVACNDDYSGLQSQISFSCTSGTTYQVQLGGYQAATGTAYFSWTGCGAATVPGTPTLTATAGNAQVSLSWTAPSNGGASITSYKVYRGTTSGGEALLTTGGCSGLGNVLSCTDTGLTNGQAYYYQVSAVNSVGEGARSAEKSATPAGTTTYFTDDFENGGALWNGYNYGFGSTWAIYTTSYHSATHSIECGDGTSYATNTDCGARSDSFSLSGATTAKLKFWHKIGGELSGGVYYDYGQVWVSKNGGTNWCLLENHIVNVAAWTEKTYDLSVCAGVIGSANVVVEFEFVSDGSVQNAGWFVDDVKVVSA